MTSYSRDSLRRIPWREVLSCVRTSEQGQGQFGQYQSQYGVQSIDLFACELLADYLSHRLQRVKIGTARSSWTELTKGVPQGSILGPLLLNRNGSSTLLLHRIKLLLLETYKSFHGMNANYLHNIFKSNCTSHERRSVKLIQPKRRTTSYGLRSFSYLGSKLWYDIVNSEPGIVNCDFDDLMYFLKHWKGPNMNEDFPYVWHFYYFECAIV